ncbi:MAG: EAL domain-containing protein [Steroidobacteraceae bacterium]
MAPPPAPPRGRGRLLLYLSIGILVLVAGGIAASAHLLMQPFRFLEERATRDETVQVLRAFTADLRQLDLSTRDYAEWDDAEAYTRTRDPAFLKGNFSRDSLEGMHVDLVWMLERDGTDAYSARLATRTHDFVEPANAALLAELRPKLAGLRALQPRPPTERLVSTSEGILAVAVFEIRRSDKSTPTGVLLVFGRFIRDDVIHRVTEASALGVRSVSLQQGRDPSATLTPPVMMWLHDPVRSAQPLALPVNDGYIDGYGLLRDVDGQPALVLATRVEREIVALGRRSTQTLVAAIIVLVALSMLAIGAVLLRARHSWRARIAVERRYREIVSQVQEAILLVDAADGRIVDCNVALQELSGYEYAELIGMPARRLVPVAGAAATIEEALALTKSQECSIRTRDGRRRDTEISVAAIEEAEQRLLCIVARDITPRKQAERQLHEHRKQLSHIAHHDALTGLPNRLYLQARLPRVLRKVAGSERQLAVMYVDVDNFKNINDSLGHASGDQVLSVVAGRLRACTRSSDVVVRMGGDEFVVVATLLPDRAAMQVIAAKIVAALQAPIALQDSTVQVSASIGISVFPEDAIDSETLLKNADIALYQAKEAGRNNFQFFRSDMNVQLSENVALEQALRHAIGSSQLYLDYQPIVNLETHAVTSFEALCRWRHPDLGQVPPARFIAIAEKSGLILPVGEFVLREACFQLRRWVADGVRVVPIGINVSPLQLTRTDFAVLVRETTREAEIDPKWLYFEITESALLEDIDRHVATLEELRGMGCKIAIDDFGASYSTFAYLKRMPVDTLKIDRSFVADLTARAQDAAVIRGIVDMARNMGLATVAEGVETAVQTVVLRELGCQNAQGYGFSPPVSARRCRTLLNAMGAQQRWSDTMKLRALEGTGTPRALTTRRKAAGQG